MSPSDLYTPNENIGSQSIHPKLFYPCQSPDATAMFSPQVLNQFTPRSSWLSLGSTTISSPQVLNQFELFILIFFLDLLPLVRFLQLVFAGLIKPITSQFYLIIFYNMHGYITVLVFFYSCIIYGNTSLGQKKGMAFLQRDKKEITFLPGIVS